MQPLDSDGDAGDQDRDVDQIVEDLKQDSIAERKPAEALHRADNAEDQERQPVLRPIDAAAKAEEECPPIHSPLVRAFDD
jgi:hypothetical protein